MSISGTTNAFESHETERLAPNVNTQLTRVQVDQKYEWDGSIHRPRRSPQLSGRAVCGIRAARACVAVAFLIAFVANAQDFVITNRQTDFNLAPISALLINIGTLVLGAQIVNNDARSLRIFLLSIGLAAVWGSVYGGRRLLDRPNAMIPLVVLGQIVGVTMIMSSCYERRGRRSQQSHPLEMQQISPD